MSDSTAYVADARAPYYARVYHGEIDDGYSRIPDGRRSHAIAVHVMLARHAGKDRSAFPSITRLQKLTGLSRGIVVDSLKWLVRVGLIVKAEGKTEKNQRINIYTLTLPPKGGVVHEVNYGSSSGELGVVHEVNSKKKQLEEETKKNSRRDADASPGETNWFEFFCKAAKLLDVTITPEDRKHTARHFKDLVRLEEPTDAEMKVAISKMLEARASGFDMSPQKALGKVRGVRHLKVVGGNDQPSRPGGGLPELKW